MCGERKGATMMKHSSMFNECERFLKRVLKDKGLFSKGAVIAYLITGGIGFIGMPTVDAAEGTVKGNPHSGGTTIDYGSAKNHLLTYCLRTSCR